MRAQVEQLAKGSGVTARGRSTTGGKPAQSKLPIEEGNDEDLTAIKGIGPKMMEKLYAQGIRNFAKLAQINTELAEQLDESLKTQGRILREDWIGQAKKLLG